ncbi:MRG/MORF4L-binding protein [Ceratina calcarata]|uniref:MRG/MORF4L-binding protein n=1 Tax=Ceratina calcarata TaxID=156304 RepID=A0AAJ7J177_9HYME|nr:MRG/MORF4L-binding protein [Ceratina calcarata]
MAVKEKQTDASTDEVEWNVENEIQLFFAMNGHKPVGINKYFHMVCIWEKFRVAVHKDVSLKSIWEHLESMYDLMALDDMEDPPFPNQEIDFCLPEQDFGGLLKSKKRDESDIKLKEQRDKYKEIKKDKDVKDPAKKDTVLRDLKGSKDIDKKKEEYKKFVKDIEIKKDKLRDVKDVRKDYKSSKGRSKGKDDLEEASNDKKERRDSDSGRESLKRGPKRPTRQSMDSTSKTSSSPRDTPPPKRRRI